MFCQTPCWHSGWRVVFTPCWCETQIFTNQLQIDIHPVGVCRHFSNDDLLYEAAADTQIIIELNNRR
jgi:hypothetical protein